MDDSKDTIYSLLGDEELSIRERRDTIKFSIFGAFNYSFLLYVVLALSIGANVFFLLDKREASKPSAFAQLIYDTVVSDERGAPYNSENASESMKAWEAVSYDAGEIILDHDYAASMGLPPAQPWVWDNSKGVYFINAYHGLHCLTVIHRTYSDLLEGASPSYDSEHIYHCLNAMRQDIMCQADDTPRYTGWAHPGNVGYGQPRICRNWKKLEAWAMERSACWRDINPTSNTDELLKFRYCPPGKKWDAAREKIRSIWGDVEQGEGASWNI